MAAPVHNGNGYLWFGDLMLAVMRAMEKGATVTRHSHVLPRTDLAFELEVRIVSVNGKALPRVSEASLSAKPKSPKKGA